MLAYYESAMQGKGAWGRGSLSEHKDYIFASNRKLHKFATSNFQKTTLSDMNHLTSNI